VKAIPAPSPKANEMKLEAPGGKKYLTGVSKTPSIGARSAITLHFMFPGEPLGGGKGQAPSNVGPESGFQIAMADPV